MGAKHRAPSRLPSTAARSPTTGSATSGDRARGAPPPPTAKDSSAAASGGFCCWLRRRLEKRERKQEGAGRNDGVFSGAGVPPGRGHLAPAPAPSAAESGRKQKKERN